MSKKKTPSLSELKINFNALTKFEEANNGVGLFEVLGVDSNTTEENFKFEISSFKMTVFNRLVWAGLQTDFPDLAESDVLDLIGEDDFTSVIENVSKALVSSLGNEEKGDSETSSKS